MKKSTLFIFSSLIIAGCIITGIVSSVNSQENMRTTDNSLFKHPARPAAVFNHDEHNQKAGIDQCNICHHVYRGREKVEYESSEDHRCSDCHALNSKNTVPPLMKAYHQRCKGCHEEQKKGPLMCGKCHQQQNAQERLCTPF